ncbi:MAG TPA: CHRD domain-containing protein [Gaiellaceae bacterium]|nr:CHRD domain-containing protein [Gaiellaceae bacterium]
MRTPLVAGLAVVIALSAVGYGLAGRGSATKLTARLNAAQETPAPKAAARGGGVFTATLNGRTLTWRLMFARLTGRATAAHIHLGPQGTAGPVAVPLCGPCFSGVHRRLTVTPKVRSALLAGTAYVNVHTAKNPAGEIRGQIAGPHGVMPPTARTTTAPTTTDSGGYGY